MHSPRRGSLSSQIGDEPLGCFEISRLKALGKPIIDRWQQVTRPIGPAAVAPQTGEARGCALVDLVGFNELLQTGDRGLVRCPTPPVPADSTPPTELSRYREPCRRLEHILVEIEVVRRELGHWNTVSQWLANSSPLNWIAPLTGGASRGVSAEDWQTSELRSTFLMAELTGVIRPTLLGLLEACT
jgi:hypothetical protein